MTKKEFRDKWLKTFASSLPRLVVEKYANDYIWHIFSYNLLDKGTYSVGDRARAEFEKVNKKGAFYIDWDFDDEPNKLTYDLCAPKALDKFSEIYVVGKDFEWTYIKTHEGDLCGPYFLKLK